MAEPAADLPWPAGHVAQAVHDDCPAELVNVPKAHAAHTRSDVAVAALLVYCPAGHGLRTAAHAAPLSSPENVEPTAHGLQTRFAVAEPAADMPNPASHLRHILHLPLPVLELNCPIVHVSHTRSVVGVGIRETYSPAAHGLRTARHATTVSDAEYDTPLMHAVHARSVVGAPSSASPNPAAHTLHGVHETIPGTELNVPSAHTLHTRSDEIDANASVYFPASHELDTAAHAAALSISEKVMPELHSLHCLSDVIEPAVCMPEPAGHVSQAVHDDCPAELVNVPEAHAAHTRLDDAVAALLMYCPAGHGLRTAAHAAPLSSPENVDPTAQAAHWRS